MSTKFTSRVRRGLFEIDMLAQEYVAKHGYDVSAKQQKDVELARAWIAEKCAEPQQPAKAASNWFTKQFNLRNGES